MAGLRGRRQTRHGQAPGVGSTRGLPILVGKADESRASVHPRVRGEIPGRDRRSLQAGRFTPRVRGEIGDDRYFDARLCGFTPACAGRSPRHEMIEMMTFGSPPRARGDLFGWAA